MDKSNADGFCYMFLCLVNTVCLHFSIACDVAFFFCGDLIAPTSHFQIGRHHWALMWLNNNCSCKQKRTDIPLNPLMVGPKWLLPPHHMVSNLPEHNFRPRRSQFGASEFDSLCAFCFATCKPNGQSNEECLLDPPNKHRSRWNQHWL